MFAKFPQRITSSFGLLGDEAKLAFPSQPSGILKLSTTRNIPEGDDYWNQYFVLFDSASEAFSLITPFHIRRALHEAPENVITLIRVVCKRMFVLVSDHTFPSPPPGAVTAFASSLIKTATSSGERNATKELLNCIRVLQRILPVLFEFEGEGGMLETEIFWKKEEVEMEQPNQQQPNVPQFVIEDDEEEVDEGESERDPPTPPPTATAAPKKQLPSLGERLFNTIIDLMFCCGFTLPIKIQINRHKINHVIWEKGVGSTTDPGPAQAYESNKTELLRLLLILLSRQIYIPAGSLATKPSSYTLHLVQNIPRRDVLTILCSLLNTAINSTASADVTFGNIAGKLPYNHLVFKGEDSRSILVGICFQVLCVILDFQSGSAQDTINDAEQTSAPTLRTNSFRYFVMKLHRTQDFDFIFNGILAILEQQITAANNLLPGARKTVPYVTEAIILLWKTIELNKKFRAHMLASDRAMDLIAYLLCHALDIKDKPQQHGMCRALSYIIQTLSAEPAFGSKLSKPVRGQVPAKWQINGTAADFIIHAIYAIVATTSGSLNSIYPALIIALSNAAPHFSKLTVTASARLVQLFTSFANPLFLLSDEGHPRLLFFMLEIFNSVILHNLADNPNLIYNVLTSHKVFEDLGTFTLGRGLREIRRAQLAKEELAKKTVDTKGKGKDSFEPDTTEAGAEKARLLESEHGRARSRNSLNLSEAQRSSPAGRESRDTGTNTSSPAASQASLPSSEKSRGKMRERRSVSVEMDETMERFTAAGVGRNGFIPTQEWVTSWQHGLPLDPVMLVISEFLPKLQEMQASRHRTTSASAIVEFLSTVSLEGVLPEVPPVVTRTFIWSDASIIWLTSLIWGEIYVRGMTPLGIWNATNVRLFYVKHAQTQQRQLTDTVTDVVGGFLRGNTDVLTPTRQR